MDLSLILLLEQRQLLDTYLNQIIHTLERANAAEQAKDAILEMQAESLINSLLSGISHDLRNPLATIIGSALQRLDKKLKNRQVNILMVDHLALVHVDAVLLQQVMVNLLDNADKYSPPERPILSFRFSLAYPTIGMSLTTKILTLLLIKATLSMDHAEVLGNTSAAKKFKAYEK